MTRVFRYQDEQLDDEDDTILKDGETYRVPVFLRDLADYVLVDGLGQPLDATAGRRSGYVFADHGHDVRESNRDLRKAMLSAEYRGGLVAGDLVKLGDRDMVVAGYDDAGKIHLADASAADADELKRQAWEDSVAELGDRWRSRPPRDEDEEEEEEQRPRKKKKKPDEWEVAGPLSDADAIQRSDAIRREAWEASVRDLEDAWRR